MSMRSSAPAVSYLSIQTQDCWGSVVYFVHHRNQHATYYQLWNKIHWNQLSNKTYHNNTLPSLHRTMWTSTRSHFLVYSLQTGTFLILRQSQTHLCFVRLLWLSVCPHIYQMSLFPVTKVTSLVMSNINK